MTVQAAIEALKDVILGGETGGREALYTVIEALKKEKEPAPQADTSSNSKNCNYINNYIADLNRCQAIVRLALNQVILLQSNLDNISYDIQAILLKIEGGNKCTTESQ